MNNKILVIDDDAIFRELIRNILIPKGFFVEEATNGQDGMDFIKDNPPDVVITDIFMPEKDGFQLIKELHHDYPEIKIIVMTGYSSLEDTDFSDVGIAEGAHYCLKKPFDSNSIISAVEKLCE